MSINPREAAVAATLAGAVVVVLGYASGLGLRVPFIEAAVVKPPISIPAAPVAPLPTPQSVILPPAIVTMVPPSPETVVPTPAVPSPSAPPSPATPPPPVAPPNSCDSGLLGSLLEPVDSLLGGLLGGGLLGSSDTSGKGGLLAGTVGSLLGSCSSDSGSSLLKSGVQ